MKFRFPGGIRTSLTIALLLIVGGALGGAYLMVVPSLERRLVDDRLVLVHVDGGVAGPALAQCGEQGSRRDELGPRNRPVRGVPGVHPPVAAGAVDGHCSSLIQR